MSGGVFISGEPADPRVLRELEEAARALRSDPRLAPRPGSLDLPDFQPAIVEQTPHQLFARRLRERLDLDTQPFAFPGKPGALGRVMVGVRAFLWKLLRYQHNRMASRQNRVNGWLLSAMEMHHARLQDELDDVKRRLERLERTTGGSDADRIP